MRGPPGWGPGGPPVLLCVPPTGHAQQAMRAGPVLPDVAGAQAEDVVEAAVGDGDVQQSGLGGVAVSHLGEAEAAGVAGVDAQGFPAREQLGVLQLEVLHRYGRCCRHGVSFG